MLRNVKLSDAVRLTEIYNYYITNTIITFEETVISAQEMEERICRILHKNYPCWVYEEAGKVTGYAYVDTWRSRRAFDITLETSIYLDINEKGRGIGTVLYQRLIEEARQINIHSLIGVISLPNDESIRLHRKLGFQPAGNFKESGWKFDRLIDVEFWQLMLNEEG
jgi:phosphinothricin acetyltransferase